MWGKNGNTVRWRIGDAADQKDDSRFDSYPDYKNKNNMIVLPIVLFALSVYMLIRNELVSRLRGKLIDTVFQGDNWQKKVEIYRSVSYNRMMLSFKPIKLESFYTQEEVEILKK